MIFQQIETELLERIHYIDNVTLLELDIKNYFRVPVNNNTNHGITIGKNFIIGHLEYLSSIVPLEVITITAKTGSNINKQKPSSINLLEISKKSTWENEEKDCDHQHQKKALEKIDLSELTCDQREQVRVLIKEESSVF